MRLTQPDRRSCGAAVLVMARRLVDPGYAVRVGDQAAFAREVTSLHRRVTSAADSAGRFQVPWPRAIGTPPWAMARELRLITGADYTTRAARRGGLWEHLRRTSPDRPAAVFVGDRLSPRHVVLVARVVGGAAWTYEPAAGVATPVDRSRWTEGPLRLAGWDRPWLVVAAAQPIRSA